MGFFSFLGDVLKQVLVKLITWILILIGFLLAIKYFLKVDIFQFF